MEGAMFYWIFWSLWVYLTFILNKQNIYRFKLSAIILMVIILVNFHFTAAGYDLNMGGLFLLFLSYGIYYKEKTSLYLYFFLCSFIITISYVTFHLYEIFDPVWLVFNAKWMIGIGIGYLALLLQKTLKGRLLITISGMMQGEILYGFILNKYDFPYQIGSLESLDICALTSLLLVGWNFIEHAGYILESYVAAGQKNKQNSS